MLFVICVLVAPTLYQSTFAQTQPESATVDSTSHLSGQPGSLRWYTMFANIPHDWVRFTRITLRSSNLPIFVGMTVLTGALIATDDETWKLSDRFYRHSVTVRDGSDFFEFMGDGRPQFGLAAGFALYGFALSDQRALRTGSQLVEAILASGAVVQLLKHVTGRQSPYVSTEPRGVWDFFPNQIDYHKHVPSYDAYPSGHIATAMATLTVVAESYPEWKWVRPVGYTIIGLLGVSMVNTGIHWYSDFPLGIALGYSFGMLAAHPEGLPAETTPDHKAPTVSIAPVVNALGTGLGCTVSF